MLQDFQDGKESRVFEYTSPLRNQIASPLKDNQEEDALHSKTLQTSESNTILDDSEDLTNEGKMKTL